MAAYAQYGCGYPSANQYLPGGPLTNLTTHHPLASQSPLATANTPSNAPSISPPSNGHNDSNVSGDNNSGSGTLTPDPVSQNSHNTMSTPSVATGTSSTDSGSGTPYACAASVNGGAAMAAAAAASAIAPPCCDNGRPMMTDPITGQTVCSCQYDPTRLALSSYARMQSGPAVGVSVYGTPYPSNEQNPYPSIGVDSGPFYTSLSNPYVLKEGSSSSSEVPPPWSSAGLQPSTGYYTYDPTFGAYGYGASYDLAARRKNATRESTATLKAWLNEHKKNPYPTKGEKIMLAIITKMTLTQVSTWFANARRRLKKENKMTWEPKNRTEDDEDALASDEEKESRDDSTGTLERRRHEYGANNNIAANNGVAGVEAVTATSNVVAPAVPSGMGSSVGVAGVGVVGVGVVQPKDLLGPTITKEPLPFDSYTTSPSQPQPLSKYPSHPAENFTGYTYIKDELSYGANHRPPRIWSLADTAGAEPFHNNNNLLTTPSNWPSNYPPPPYVAPAGEGSDAANKHTAVVATISMQQTPNVRPSASAYSAEVENEIQTRPNPLTVGAYLRQQVNAGRDNQACANLEPNQRYAEDIYYKRQHYAYQSQSAQYARNLFYGSNATTHQQFQSLPLQVATQQQQQQPPLQQHRVQQQQQLPAMTTQSAIAALSQHVAESTIWQQHQQQQHHQHHHQ